MKKSLTIFTLVLLAAMLMPASAFAKGNIKGEVVSIDGATITVETNKGEFVVVHVPADFDLSTLQVGDSVLVKGTLLEDGTVQAETMKEVGGGGGDVGEGDDDDDDDDGQGKGQGKGKGPGDDDDDDDGGGLADSAWCNGSKEGSHPVAVGIAATYGVSEETIMGYFCQGYSFGPIMLAYQTNALNGADVETLLAERSAGQGWGQIWQGLGLIGDEAEGHSPPGLLKKPDHAGPPEGKGPNK